MKLRLVEKQNLKETDYNYLNKEIQTTVYDAFDGTDFMISGVELMDDGRITFNVLAMGPDGEMEREAELYVPEINYLDAVREACENWMLDHGTPDSFYESKLNESGTVDELTNGTYSTFKDYNKEYENSPTMKYSETSPYDLDAMKIWIDIRDDLTYTDNPNIAGDWYQLDITGGYHTKYGTNFIYIEPKQKLWRIQQTGSEFYNCGGRPDFKELLKDSEESEATQTEDIAKKEEYKKMVEPSFKVGKRIKK